MPGPLWIVLGLGAVLTIAYMCVQADRREGVVVQAVTIGFITTMVTAGLLVVAFLDHPYADQTGSIEPTEMRRTLALIDGGSAAPCDVHNGGHPSGELTVHGFRSTFRDWAGEAPTRAR